MGRVLHGSTRTTEAIRRAIQHSEASIRALAGRYGFNPKTVAKWKRRHHAAAAPIYHGGVALGPNLVSHWRLPHDRLRRGGGWGGSPANALIEAGGGSMAEIVNLRVLRKRKARAEAARQAAGNRALSRLREARSCLREAEADRPKLNAGSMLRRRQVGARSKVGRPRVQNAMAPRHALVTRGRRKAEREMARREAERAGRALDGVRLKREEG